MEVIIVAISIFLSIAILSETFGVWARVIGAFNGEPTNGYSTHVRIATLGRFFILLSAPTIGFMVDGGMRSNNIALIGAIYFTMVTFSIVFFIKSGHKYFYKIYGIINRKSVDISINQDILNSMLETKITFNFFTWVFLSFILTSSGVIVVNYLAANFHDMRAMIVQMYAVTTMFGKLIHVFFIDPRLSKAADTDKMLLLEYSVNFLYSRLLSSIVLGVIFIIMYFYV